MSQHAVRLRAPTVGAIALVALATVAVFAVVVGCAMAGPRASSPSGPRSGTTAGTSAGTTAGTGAAPSRTTALSAPATITANHVFAAQNSNGAPAAGVVAHRSGSCFTSSILVSAADAFRCFAGNQLLDPCFASSVGAKALMCYASPWSQAVELTLTAPLPAAPPLSFARPWAIELANDQRCVAVSGTALAVRGVLLGYHCAPKTSGNSGTGASGTRASGTGASGTAGLRSTAGPLLLALYRAPTGALQQVAVLATWKA